VTVEVKHTKVSEKSDGQDPSLIQPSHWNASHRVTVSANSLVGRAEDSEGDAEAISIGPGLTLDKPTNMLSAGVVADVAVGTVPSVTSQAPNYRVLTNTGSITWDKTTVNQMKANLADEGVTLAKLEKGTQGEILVYGAGGVAEHLPHGNQYQALLAQGAAQTAKWGGVGYPHAVLVGQRSAGDPDGAFASGAWRTRLVNVKRYDLFNVVTLTPATSRFVLAAGTYVVEWSAPGWKVGRHQTRLWNASDNTTIGIGTSSFSAVGATEVDGDMTTSLGTAMITVIAGRNLEIQHQCSTTGSFGSAANFGISEIYAQVKIWLVELT
jgi:hypothetical protein